MRICWLFVLVTLGTGCDLSDLTSGRDCDGKLLCELFDGTGVIAERPGLTIRTTGAGGTVTRENGVLRSTVSSATDCTYSDLTYNLPVSADRYELETRVRRSADDRSFFLVIAGGACLHLLFIKDGFVTMQTNQYEDGMTRVDPTKLPARSGDWSTIKLVAAPSLQGGVTFALDVDGGQAVITRPLCKPTVDTDFTVGQFCTGGAGIVEFDYLKVSASKPVDATRP